MLRKQAMKLASKASHGTRSKSGAFAIARAPLADLGEAELANSDHQRGASSGRSGGEGLTLSTKQPETTLKQNAA